MSESSKRAAVVLGSSGSVGQALVKELVRDRTFAPVIVLVRRSQPELVALAQAAGVELREVVVSAMEPPTLEAATRAAVAALPGGAVGFSTLGVGAGTGKLTIDQHRAVDVELNAAFARGLAASGRVEHLAFMSAVGANPTARASGSGAAGMPRYARVKGEAEEAVKASGLAVVSIFRPSTIVGSQHTPRLLGKVMPALNFMTPSKLKAITVEQIARAMVATARTTPPATAVYHHREMLAHGQA